MGPPVLISESWYKRAGQVHRLNLLLETRGALDRLAHVLAAFARQRVGIVLQPPQGLGAGQALALNLGVELGCDPVEFLERAAQTLTVLLREFRLASRSVRPARRLPRLVCALASIDPSDGPGRIKRASNSVGRNGGPQASSKGVTREAAGSAGPAK